LVNNAKGRRGGSILGEKKRSNFKRCAGKCAKKSSFAATHLKAFSTSRTTLNSHIFYWFSTYFRFFKQVHIYYHYFPTSPRTHNNFHSLQPSLRFILYIFPFLAWHFPLINTTNPATCGRWPRLAHHKCEQDNAVQIHSD